MHSFDTTRQRRAPRHYEGTNLWDEPVSGEFTCLTLIVAIKEDCWGCRNILECSPGEMGDVTTLLVAAQASRETSWRSSPHRVLISASLLKELDVRWPPFYVLFDPTQEKVMSEGVVFDAHQVREEIAPFLM